LKEFSLCVLGRNKAVANMEVEKDLPRDAKVIESILKSMGVEDHEPRVLNQFLEFMHKYVADVLLDAQAYSGMKPSAGVCSFLFQNMPTKQI
jgi:hypothetical protein